MKNINENITITTENQNEWKEKLKNCETISGYVDVYKNAKFSAPKLKQSGYVNVYENVKFSAPKLETISSSVYVYKNAKFSAPRLKQSGSVYVNENAKFSAPKLETVSDYVYVNENAKFSAPKLKQSGSVDVNENAKLEKQLWKIASKNKWYVSDKSSEWLLKKKGNFVYQLSGVIFEKEWFDKIRKDKLSAEEVLAIDNTEHRRVAFEYMDKTKMKQLKDFKILDKVKDDGYGNPMNIWSFTIQNMDRPLKFLNCFCPTTKREYFLGTDKDKCWEAKAGLIGFEAKDIEYVKEW